MTTKIPEDILESASYLAYVFSKSMHSIVDSKQDLYHDLIVLYLDKKNSSKFKSVAAKKDRQEYKNYCFTVFKNYLLDKYKRIIIKRKIDKELLRHAKQQQDSQRIKKPINC
ncbi:hypothetical protein LCGC14_0305770 [marine sediment metagenome]|uniref:Uncharacterized protein n=1 Tax=marine sediment metagenome TaxID=412755 RepID=A0A0F9WV32_9ZZZZ